VILIRSAGRMAAIARRLERRGRRIGIVPTMGALHDGHASLIRRAAAENDVVIVTVFVNPLQFGPGEDFARYPRMLRRDLARAHSCGADIVFAPKALQFYPRGFQTAVEPGGLARRWEGASRPGHFRGVATVVAMLFQLTRPTTAYFGQKDYQQACIVKRLVRDLHFPLRIRVLPTVRERDGLAMSSRNASLGPAGRARALVLIRSLRSAAARIRGGERSAARVAGMMRSRIRREPGVRLDYAAVVDAATLEPLSRLRGRVSLLVAARVGRTRLIDNVLVDVP
jgi:pantoate--beta-alanine ligase